MKSSSLFIKKNNKLTIKIKLILLISFVGMSSFQPVFALPNSDLQVFIGCYFQVTTTECQKADFNQDGYINIQDYFQLYTSLIYDLNNDGVIDVSSIDGNTDLAIVNACIGMPLTDQCKRADFNNDNIVDSLDYNLIYAAGLKFDLDGDLRAEYYIDNVPLFDKVNDQAIMEGRELAFYVVAYDNDNEAVNYEITGISTDAKLTSLLFGDVDGDGLVSDNDVGILKSYTLDHGEVETTNDARFDLNNDKIIDAKDITYLESKLGKQIPAVFVTWKPEDKDSGVYPTTVSAYSFNIDGVKVTTTQTFKITVVDRNATSGYYNYNDVMLVINDNSIESRQIGEYFIQQRRIRQKNVVHISSSTNETVNWTTYVNQIALPIKDYLSANRLNTKINYIVTTKGVPLRIYEVNYPLPIIGRTFPGQSTLTLARSVDGQIATIAMSSPETAGPYYGSNPYFNSEYPFSSEMYNMYIVTRLTGYTVTDAIGLVDRATNTASDGVFVFDTDPSKDNPGYKIGNDWMRNASNILEAKNWQTSLDETTTYLTNQANVLGYVSWGSNDAHDSDNGRPYNMWLPGAIVETYVSSSARTFTFPPIYGQSLIADLITEGVTGAKGYTFEPYLGSMARPDILFPKYTDGFTLADSYSAASFYLGWRGMVVGDPKASIGRNLTQWDKSGAVQIAEDWITKLAPTYRYDGSGLTFVMSRSRLCAYCYQISYEFTSEYPGYGDRSGTSVVTTQLTMHQIVINVDLGKVTRAITDGVFDEINQTILSIKN